MRVAMAFYHLLSLLHRLFPLRANRYFCISMTGRSYGDNVKALADYILQQEASADVVWAFDKPFAPREVAGRVVHLYTFKYMYYLFTSAYIISNCRMFHAIMPRKRKGQLYVQTWHGTALKHVEADAPNLSEKYKRESIHDSSMIDVFVSGSKFMTKIYKESFWYKGRIFETGTPRNDLLFYNDGVLRARLRSSLGIITKKVVLYAPTFRETDGGLGVYGIDTVALQRVLEETTKEAWTVVLRLHPNIVTEKSKKEIEQRFSNCIDVSAYPDMMDLLFMSDVLISDYSSSIFDFLYTGRPCFIYAPDIDSYERGFYFNFNELPFPVASDNMELHQLIKTFDQNEYEQNTKDFLKHIGSAENGDASNRVYQVMCNYDLSLS